MSWKKYWQRARRDADFEREVAAHLAHETDRGIERGMSAEDARLAALRKLGNRTALKESIREMNTLGILETIWQDLRHGLRLLWLNPGFAAVAILSLALGVGANTAIFQLLNAVRLRTLPVPNPQELAELHIARPRVRTGNFLSRQSDVTNPIWEQIRDRQQAFSGIFAWAPERFNLAREGEARYAEGLWVSGDFFRTLQAPAVLGRTLAADDDRRGCSPGVVIGHAFWQREFGADPSILTRTVMLNRHSFPILGVTAPGFFGVEVGRRFDVAVPLCAQPLLEGADNLLDVHDAWFLGVMGRLKAYWTLDRANAQLRAISQGVFHETLPPHYNTIDGKRYLAFHLEATSAGTGMSELRRTSEAPLWLLLAASGLVLLIACANLANLMLARASARGREISVRLAIGASRGRIVRQILAESLVIAGGGAAVGLLIAHSLSRVLVGFLSTGHDPLFLNFALDWRVVLFIIGTIVFTSLLFGLAPALKATREPAGVAVALGGRGLTATRDRLALRRALIVSQVALSMVLLVGALLFVGSLRNMLLQDPGFRADGILIAEADLGSSLPTAQRREYFRRIVERMQASPAIDSVAETAIVPLRGSFWDHNVTIGGQEVEARFNEVGGGYFRAMGTALLAGRDFNRDDGLESPSVAIVNQTFASKYSHNANPVGSHFAMERRPGALPRDYTIVGLVRDAKYNSLREPFKATVYLAASQDNEVDASATWLIRSRSNLAGAAGAVKEAVKKIAPNATLSFEPFRQNVQDSLLGERLMASLSGFFAALAGLLAAIGIYGVLSYMVARRRHEIGIRMALGADRGQVVRMILREAAVLSILGLAIGIGLAMASAQTIKAMLFGLSPGDGPTLLAAAAGLALIALVSAYLPARRASRVNPAGALREE